MRGGFVKIDRKITEWEWYTDVTTKTLFLHLLVIASFRPSRYKGSEILPGQIICGLQSLGDGCGLTVQQVRTSLKKLESTGEISKKSTSRGTLITIVKWGVFQGGDENSNKQITNKQQTNNKQITTLKNVKNVKNVKNNNINRSKEDFWEDLDQIINEEISNDT